MSYFLAVAQERSFTRAAARCRIAQPSLSRQIHDIERTLGTSLFDRLPRDVRMTAAGEIFAKEAVKTLEHSRRAMSLVRALEREKDQRLRVGLSALCDLPRMRGLIEAVQMSGGRVPVECVAANTTDLSLSLLRGKLDLAVIDLPIRERGLNVFPIYKEPIVATLPQRHLLAQRPMVRLFELKNERVGLISQQIDPASDSIEMMLRRAGMCSSVAWTGGLIDLLDEVAVHPVVGLVRSSAIRMRREGVVYKPLADSIQLEAAIAGRKDDHRPHILSFRNALLAFAQRPLAAAKMA